MKIVFLSADMCDGGSQRVISLVAKGLATRGHIVYMYIFAKGKYDYQLDSNIHVEYMCENQEEYDNLHHISRIRKIRKYLKKTNADVAIGFLQAGYALYISSLFLSIKRIASLRISPSIFEAKSGLQGFIQKWWFKHADGVVLQTSAQLDYAKKNGWKNPVVIQNPIPNSLFNKNLPNLNSICSKLMMVGRLVPQKNYKLAIQAFQQVCEMNPNLTLSIYGTGPERDNIQKLIQEYQLEDKINLCGWFNDISSEYQKFDLYMMTSLYEGLPNSLMEAMAMGLPCISTDCPTGPAELITDSVSGYLVRNNDIDSLTNAIKNVISMSLNDRIRMSSNATEYISSHFSEELISEKWEMYLLSIL